MAEEYKVCYSVQTGPGAISPFESFSTRCYCVPRLALAACAACSVMLSIRIYTPFVELLLKGV